MQLTPPQIRAMDNHGIGTSANYNLSTKPYLISDVSRQAVEIFLQTLAGSSASTLDARASIQKMNNEVKLVELFKLEAHEIRPWPNISGVVEASEVHTS